MPNIPDIILLKLAKKGGNSSDLIERIESYVNDSINQSSAFYRGLYSTKNQLLSVQWQSYNPLAQNYVSNNDYAVVESDETHNGESWRYIYVYEQGGQNNGWSAQYRVNEKDEAVKFVAQQLTDTQKEQARENIEAVNYMVFNVASYAAVRSKLRTIPNKTSVTCIVTNGATPYFLMPYQSDLDLGDLSDKFFYGTIFRNDYDSYVEDYYITGFTTGDSYSQIGSKGRITINFHKRYQKNDSSWSDDFCGIGRIINNLLSEGLTNNRVNNALDARQGKLIANMFAVTETASTTASAHLIGSYFIKDSILYIATANIAIGDTITPGTNCEVVSIGGELQKKEKKSESMTQLEYDALTQEQKMDGTIRFITDVN